MLRHSSYIQNSCVSMFPLIVFLGGEGVVEFVELEPLESENLELIYGVVYLLRKTEGGSKIGYASYSIF